MVLVDVHARQGNMFFLLRQHDEDQQSGVVSYAIVIISTIVVMHAITPPSSFSSSFHQAQQFYSSSNISAGLLFNTMLTTVAGAEDMAKAVIPWVITRRRSPAYDDMLERGRQEVQEVRRGEMSVEPHCPRDAKRATYISQQETSIDDRNQCCLRKG